MAAMLLPVTGTFTGVLGLLCTGLATRIGFRRLANGPSHGVGADTKASEFECRVRAHGNAAEQVPLFLVMLSALELNKVLTNPQLVALGAVFSVARTAHSLQLSEPKAIPFIFRPIGFCTQGACFIIGCATLLAKCAKSCRK